jgi:hypothetical protein
VVKVGDPAGGYREEAIFIDVGVRDNLREEAT